MNSVSFHCVLAVGLIGLACRVCCGAPLDRATTAPEALLPAKLADLDVPLTVQDSAGVERKGDTCSTGVPLPLGLIKEPEFDFCRFLTR